MPWSFRGAATAVSVNILSLRRDHSSKLETTRFMVAGRVKGSRPIRFRPTTQHVDLVVCFSVSDHDRALSLFHEHRYDWMRAAIEVARFGLFIF